MIWQDIVLAIGGFGFVIALIPSIRTSNKPDWKSSLMTGSILLIFTICYATLGLWLAFCSTLLVSACWFLLLYQVLKMR